MLIVFIPLINYLKIYVLNCKALAYLFKYIYIDKTSTRLKQARYGENIRHFYTYLAFYS